MAECVAGPDEPDHDEVEHTTQVANPPPPSSRRPPPQIVTPAKAGAQPSRPSSAPFPRSLRRLDPGFRRNDVECDEPPPRPSAPRSASATGRTPRHRARTPTPPPAPIVMVRAGGPPTLFRRAAAHAECVAGPDEPGHDDVVQGAMAARARQPGTQPHPCASPSGEPATTKLPPPASPYRHPPRSSWSAQADHPRFFVGQRRMAECVAGPDEPDHDDVVQGATAARARQPGTQPHPCASPSGEPATTKLPLPLSPGRHPGESRGPTVPSVIRSPDEPDHDEVEHTTQVANPPPPSSRRPPPQIVTPAKAGAQPSRPSSAPFPRSLRRLDPGFRRDDVEGDEPPRVRRDDVEGDEPPRIRRNDVECDEPPPRPSAPRSASATGRTPRHRARGHPGAPPPPDERPATGHAPRHPHPPRSSWSAQADHPRFFVGQRRMRNAWLVRMNRAMTMWCKVRWRRGPGNPARNPIPAHHPVANPPPPSSRRPPPHIVTRPDRHGPRRRTTHAFSSGSGAWRNAWLVRMNRTMTMWCKVRLRRGPGNPARNPIPAHHPVANPLPPSSRCPSPQVVTPAKAGAQPSLQSSAPFPRSLRRLDPGFRRDDVEGDEPPRVRRDDVEGDEPPRIRRNDVECDEPPPRPSAPRSASATGRTPRHRARAPTPPPAPIVMVSAGGPPTLFRRAAAHAKCVAGPDKPDHDDGGGWGC